MVTSNDYDREKYVQYIIKQKRWAGHLRDCTDEQLQEWAKTQRDEDIESVANSLRPSRRYQIGANRFV